MTTKSRPKFLRRKPHAYPKLGKGRKNKQKWRKPNGRDNKMREKRKGTPATVSIGYRTDRIARGMLQEKSPVYIKTINELKKLRENQIPVLGRVGNKKKIEIANEAEKMKIIIYNLNSKKFLKENELKNKKNSEGKK